MEDIEYPADLPPHASPAAVADGLYWAYSQAKASWRKYMQKSVRQVRRFVRRHLNTRYGSESKGKGKNRDRKGKGGKGRFLTFLAEECHGAPENVFKGMSKGKGARKGKRSSGFGKGRVGNPTGPDGVMKCWDCESETHLRGSPE